jgi:hypothetical protein
MPDVNGGGAVRLGHIVVFVWLVGISARIMTLMDGRSTVEHAKVAIIGDDLGSRGMQLRTHPRGMFDEANADDHVSAAGNATHITGSEGRLPQSRLSLQQLHAHHVGGAAVVRGHPVHAANAGTPRSGAVEGTAKLSTKLFVLCLSSQTDNSREQRALVRSTWCVRMLSGCLYFCYFRMFFLWHATWMVKQK